MAIGASIVIKGEVSGSEDLVVTGRVEGNILLDAGILTLAPESHVAGEAAAPSVVVHGNVEGNIEATDRLDVRASAVIVGNLTAPVLVVADGAQVTGRVEMPERKQGAPLQFPVAV